jgi:hypothetical protein
MMSITWNEFVTRITAQPITERINKTTYLLS